MDIACDANQVALRARPGMVHMEVHQVASPFLILPLQELHE